MSIVDRIVAEGRYHRRLKVLQNELKPARERGKVGCCKSGFCCWQRPCELAPEDVPRIAAHLEVTPQALFEDWLVVDELARARAPPAAPRPAGRPLPVRRRDVGHQLTMRLPDLREPV